jgi:hypothetical protein
MLLQVIAVGRPAPIAFDARQLPRMQLSGGGVTEAQRGMHAQLAHIAGRAAPADSPAPHRG